MFLGMKMEGCLGVKKALLRFREFLFKEEVRSFLHVQAAVGLLGDEIIFFDIEPESADVGLGCSQLFDETVHFTVNPFSPKTLFNINTLDPPELPVSPITPFPGHHQGADDPFFTFCNKVKTLIRFVENTLDSGTDDPVFQGSVFSFPGHRLVEGDDRIGI